MSGENVRFWQKKTSFCYYQQPQTVLWWQENQEDQKSFTHGNWNPNLWSVPCLLLFPSTDMIQQVHVTGGGNDWMDLSTPIMCLNGQAKPETSFFAFLIWRKAKKRLYLYVFVCQLVSLNPHADSNCIFGCTSNACQSMCLCLFFLFCSYTKFCL